MVCVGCEIKEDAASFDVEQLIQDQLELEIDLVASDLLSTRLKQCEDCPFRSNHTCTKCGCFYKFRANLQHKSCPDGRW